MDAKKSVKGLLGALVAISLVLPSVSIAKDCFDQAAAYQQVNANILRAIAIKETSRCRPIVTSNRNKSIDVGCMGINSVHFNELAGYGINPDDLLDNCTNIFVAAWHYKKKVRKYGNTWKAVGAYHNEIASIRDDYARQVYAIWIRYGLNKE